MFKKVAAAMNYELLAQRINKKKKKGAEKKKRRKRKNP